MEQIKLTPIEHPNGIQTMQDVADYYNKCDVLDTSALEEMIEANGWVSDCATEWGVCHNDTETVIINDEGQAVVAPMPRAGKRIAICDDIDTPKQRKRTITN